MLIFGVGTAVTDRGERTWRRWSVLVRSVLLMPLVFLAGWWLIGDLSYEGDVEGGLDYMYEAPEVPPWLTVSIGVAAVALAFVAGRPLWKRPDLRGPVAVAVVVSALAAFFARSITAGVIGANIGGGLVLMFGVPLSAVVGASALLAIAWRTRRRR